MGASAASQSAGTRSPRHRRSRNVYPPRYRFRMAKRIGLPAAAWLACAASLVLLTLVAYGVDRAQRLDARILARLSARDTGGTHQVAEVIAHLCDPLPLL